MGVLCLSTVAEARALTSENTYTIVNENGKQVIVDNEGYFHIYFDNHGNELDAQSALEIISDFNKEIQVYSPKAVVYPYQNEMHYSSKSNYTGSRIKLTADSVGPCTISYSRGKTVTEEFSSNISGSVTLKNMLIAEVQASVGVSWSKSLSVTSTEAVSYNIPSGKTGAIYFTPYYVQYNCTYYNSDGKASSVYGRCPKKLGTGFCDGLFEMIYK